MDQSDLPSSSSNRLAGSNLNAVLARFDRQIVAAAALLTPATQEFAAITKLAISEAITSALKTRIHAEDTGCCTETMQPLRLVPALLNPSIYQYVLGTKSHAAPTTASFMAWVAADGLRPREP